MWFVSLAQAGRRRTSLKAVWDVLWMWSGRLEGGGMKLSWLGPMVVPGLIATAPLNLIESRFLCNVHQNMSFFPLLFNVAPHKRTMISCCADLYWPCIKPRWIITCFIGSFTTSGFWSNAYAMLCLCCDPTPAKLKWEALTVPLQTRAAVKAAHVIPSASVTCRSLETFSCTRGADFCRLIPFSCWMNGTTRVCVQMRSWKMRPECHLASWFLLLLGDGMSHVWK